MAAKNSVELSDKAETGSATRSESVGSERERLRNNSSPFWRPMVDAFHSIDSYEMIWLGIFGLATMVLPLISLIDMVNNSTNDHQGKPLVLFTVLLTIIFIFTALSVSLVLIFVTNDWSVSVMLAQRWNPVSYVATYFITALCHFASAWVCAVYVMRHMNGHDDPEWKICCATLSFIFIALSQLFPPAIKVKPEDLGLGELNTDNNNIAFATIVTTTGTEIIPTLLPFPKNFEFLSTVIHFALRLTGSVMGYYVIISFLNNYHSYLKFNLALSLGMIIVSAALEFSALVVMFSMISRSTEGYKEARFMRTFFGLEACFLYCMIIGVVLTVMAESGLFAHYTG